MKARMAGPLTAMVALMAACGDENGSGSGGSLFSGFSLIIVIIVVILVVAYFVRRGR